MIEDTDDAPRDLAHRWYTYNRRERIVDDWLTREEAEAATSRNPDLRVGERNLG